jgi:PAS domain S-box-containing protein
MLELTGNWARASKVALLAVPLLLGTAAVATHRTAGPLAALALLAGAVTVLLVAVVAVARRHLRRARERQRIGQQALDAVPHAVFVVDAQRSGVPNLHVNAAYCALTGYGAREAVTEGFDARAIFVGDGGFPSLDNGAERRSTRVVVRRRDGTTFPAKLELKSVPRDDGGRYLLGLLEDVTGGERAGDRLQRNRRAPAAEAAAPAARATGPFLSWLCHELRSPLNACAMWLDVLALNPQSDKLPQAIDAIKRGLARQAKLVNDLSDAAKVAAGGLELGSGRLDLLALLATGIDAWQLLAIGRQIRFNARVDLAAAPVEGDEERLRQALNHLVESSIASTPAGGSVELRVYGNGNACIIELEDGGPPLSAEDAANLGVPLERAPTSAKTRSGLGLGLAIAHHVAAKHGGSLTAEGVRFVLTLPLAAEAAPPGAKA